MKKRFLGIICLLYSSIIGYVWFSNKLKNFLAPQMQIYLKISFFLILIIGLVICFSKELNYRFKVSDLILILPIIMLICAGDGRLTTSLAKNRMTNLNTKIKKSTVKIDIDNTKKENLSTNVYFNVIDENYYDLANNLTYSQRQEQYIDKTIRVRGFASTSLPYIPDNHFIIGKYGVSCCTADASFIGFFAKFNDSFNISIKEDGWYEIEGILEPGVDKDGYGIMVINVSKIKSINSKNEEMYIYPCTSYNDGSCKEFTKYDLEY